MPINRPRKPNPGKNRVFTVTCVLNNVVYMTEKTWFGHSIPRHAEQDLIGDIEQVKATLCNASRVRRSTDPYIGPTTCVYERIIPTTSSLMRIPVLFEYPNYDQGQLLGRAMSVFMVEEGEWDSGRVGEIFWVAEEKQKEQK